MVFLFRTLLAVIRLVVKRPLITGLVLLCIEPVSPGYYLAQAMYFEARDEPLKGRLAVAAVVDNRSRYKPEFGDTITAVVTDRCQFSYRCDRHSNLPWRQAYAHWPKWLQIRAEAWVYMGLRQINLLPDPTGGALFYRNPQTATSKWFSRKVKDGTFHSPVGIGNHVFYQYK